MPNILDASGLTVNTQAELIEQFTVAFKAIYGDDINLDQDTPDGQMMMIFIQSVLDLEDLLNRVYNSFNPDVASGIVLDQRCAINGIQRKAGTYTSTNITLVASQSLNLYGTDQTENEVYTVQDAEGNQFVLVNSQVISAAGTYVYEFRAKVTGAVLTVPNTITLPVTIVLGIDSINNPDPYLTLGQNEETDAALRIRRQKSVAISSQGYLQGLLAALENIDGVTYAFVHENDTGSTDPYNVPGHSIWVIVAGSGEDADIADAIYTKRNAGCGMYNSGGAGAKNYAVQQVDGSSFTVYWDEVQPQTVFIKFTALSLDGETPPNIELIQEQLPEIYLPGVAAQLNVNQLATYVQEIDDNTLVTTAGFSSTAGGSYTSTKSTSNLNYQFVIISADIIILPMIAYAPGVTYLFTANEVSGTEIEINDGDNLQFSGQGGYGAIVYSVESGTGTINASTGLYESNGTGTDVVRVTDSLSNYSECEITVV